MIGIEIVVECRAAESAQLLKPLHMAIGKQSLAQHDIGKRRLRCGEKLWGERLVVAVVQIKAFDRIARVVRFFLVFTEKPVGNERHSAQTIFIGIGRGIVEPGAAAVLQVVVERTRELADFAFSAKREIEIGQRNQWRVRLEIVPQGILVGRATELLHKTVPSARARAGRFVRIAFEEVGERCPPGRSGRARAVRRKAVDIEIIRHIECAIGVTPRIETERSPLASGRTARIVSRLVDQRRRNIGKRLKAERRNRPFRGKLAIRAHEDPVFPDILGAAGSHHRSHSRMGIVVDGAIDRVDRARQTRLHQKPRGRRAPQIA